MNSTFYNGISGVKTHQFGIDSWSNNIANISTHGYKAQMPEFSSIFSTAMEGLNANSPISNDKSYGSMRAANGVDMTVGSLELADESPLNMALSGQGWFIVGNKSGTQISYTRDGAFGVNGNSVREDDGSIISNSGGYIVTNSGQYLYGIDLGRIDGSVFSSTPLSGAALTSALTGVSAVSALTPLKIPENLTYPPKATTEVYSALNLNPTSSLKSITSAFQLTDGSFNETLFRANDLDALYKDDGTALNLKAGNTITLDVNGAETTIVYGTDFTSINDLMNQINTISGLTSTVDETNNALKFTNNTASPIELKLKSSNVALIQTLGLPSTTTISSDASITSSSLKVPSYRALNEVYDASGTKLLLSSTYTLTSREPQTWQMQSGIYDKQGDQLLSPQTVSGTLRFDANGVLSAVTGVPVTLTLPDGSSILYDPTRDKTAVDLAAAGQSVPTLHQTTGAIYMSSTMKQNNIDGNAQGYYQGMDIDQNGIISLSFSNDKFETFGRVGVAGFINNQGLSQSDSTLFKESANSGTPTLLWNWGQKTGELRGTSVLSGKLEMSNVDLATALTELMIFQRAYSASTKSITTADEMVKEAIGLKR